MFSRSSDACEVNYVFSFVKKIELLVQQSNFLTNTKEIKAFIGVNYIMAVNHLSSTGMYWDCDHFLANVGIQNIFIRTRYQEVLQNLDFAKNTIQDKTNKDYEITVIINHLNKINKSSIFKRA